MHKLLAFMAEILGSQPFPPADLQNLYVLADAAVTLLNQQQQNRLKQQGKKKKTNVQDDAAVSLLNEQQQQSRRKQQGQQKKTNVQADAVVTLLNEQQQSRRKQQGQQKKTNVKRGQQKKTNVKKSSRKKKKRPSPTALLRVQQQRAPAEWLLQLVVEQGGMWPPAFLCAKKLTISDTNHNLNRFAVPRNVVYDVLFPLMSDDEQKQVCNTGERAGGGGLRMQCHDSLGSLSLCFRFWHSNLMFLFNDGWKLVVERNGLRPEKDVVELWTFRDASMALHFAFCIVREEEEGNVVGGGEESGLKKEEDNGVAAEGAVLLEGEATSAAIKDDNIVPVIQEKEETENERWYRWGCKRRRTTYP